MPCVRHHSSKETCMTLVHYHHADLFKVLLSSATGLEAIRRRSGVEKCISQWVVLGKPLSKLMLSSSSPVMRAVS